MKRNQRHYMFLSSPMSLAALMLLVFGVWADQADAFQRQVTCGGSNGNTATTASNALRR